MVPSTTYTTGPTSIVITPVAPTPHVDGHHNHESSSYRMALGHRDGSTEEKKAALLNETFLTETYSYRAWEAVVKPGGWGPSPTTTSLGVVIGVCGSFCGGAGHASSGFAR